MFLVGVVFTPITSAYGESKHHRVEINGFSFNPQILKIKVGDSVTWTNQDIVPHTATMGSIEKKGVWVSGKLNQGQSWSHTFKTKKNLNYFCEYHPAMKGQVIIQE